MKPRLHTDDPRAERANEPGEYVCMVCGEKLSGPARFYLCPQSPPLAKALWSEAA